MTSQSRVNSKVHFIAHIIITKIISWALYCIFSATNKILWDLEPLLAAMVLPDSMAHEPPHETPHSPQWPVKRWRYCVRSSASFHSIFHGYCTNEGDISSILLPETWPWPCTHWSLSPKRPRAASGGLIINVIRVIFQSVCRRHAITQQDSNLNFTVCYLVNPLVAAEGSVFSETPGANVSAASRKAKLSKLQDGSNLHRHDDLACCTCWAHTVWTVWYSNRLKDKLGGAGLCSLLR